MSFDFPSVPSEGNIKIKPIMLNVKQNVSIIRIKIKIGVKISLQLHSLGLV